MPNPEARAAYSEAMGLMRSMRDLHAREAVLLRATQGDSADAQQLHEVDAQVGALRSEWTELFNKYSQAMTRYTFAVDGGRTPKS
jgi:hypothetical protein